jgi:hypothetical protein
MQGGKVSIAQVMMVVALAAVNLAIARATPAGIVEFPSLWVAMGSLDFVVVRKFFQRRSFGAFHYTFLICLIVSFFVMANLVAVERFHPLAWAIRWYQQLSGEGTNRVWWWGYVWLAEVWSVSILSVLLAYGVGWVAAWLDRRRGWDIAAFWRGALVGLLLAGLLASFYDMTWGRSEPGNIRLVRGLVNVGVCVILGGVAGLRWMRSARPG